jgi:DHA2 family multidrug resistance protein-like MFS transporter
MDNFLDARRTRLAVLALCCGNSVAAVDSSILNVALPTIGKDLHAPLSATTLVVSLYQLVLLMTVLPFSALGEKFGLTRLYQIGLALFACAAVGSALAPNLIVLTGMRCLQALGSAAIMSISSALVRHVYRPEKLAAGLALNAFVVTTAAMAAPALGGAVLAFAPWRSIFLISLPLIAVALIMGRALPATPTHDEPYDYKAAGLSALTFLLLVGAMQLAIHGARPVLWASALGLGLLIGAVFVRGERRSTRPVLPVDLLAQPAMALALFGGLCVYALSQSVTLNLPFRLETVFGYAPARVGAVLAMWPFALSLTVPLSGYISNRVAPWLLGAVGMAVSFTGLVALSLVPAHPGYFDLAWRVWLCGAGIGMFLSPNNRQIIWAAPPGRIAAASGLIATMRMTGQVLGATLASLLLALGAGLGRTPTLVAAGLAAIAFVCCMARQQRTAGPGGAAVAPV